MWSQHSNNNPQSPFVKDKQLNNTSLVNCGPLPFRLPLFGLVCFGLLGNLDCPHLDWWPSSAATFGLWSFGLHQDIWTYGGAIQKRPFAIFRIYCVLCKGCPLSTRTTSTWWPMCVSTKCCKTRRMPSVSRPRAGCWMSGRGNFKSQSKWG